MRTTITLCICCSASLALGQYAVLPPGAANTVSGQGLNSPTRSAPRTIQQIVPGADLAAGGGNVLAGLTFRSAASTINPPLWPAAPAGFANYDIFMAVYSGQPGQMLSETFADNIGPGTEVQVRSGPLSIPAGMFERPSILQPNPWSMFEFAFTTPFTFDPTVNYILTIRHTGSDLTGAGADFFMETFPAAGIYQDAVVATLNGYTAETGMRQGSYIATRFHVIPSPAAGSLLAFGAAAALIRRRRAR